MAYEYEKLIGFINDLVAGVGGKDMARYVDCPKCGAPLTITIVDDDEITLVCPVEAQHLQWHGFYENLPAWIDEYKSLNT